jgi:hypothetical protein
VTAHRFTLQPDSHSAFLAAMAVGDTLTFPWRDHIRTEDRKYARLRLGEPNAQWRGRTTTKGLRVTRIR